jgi:hypothetical protein
MNKNENENLPKINIDSNIKENLNLYSETYSDKDKDTDTDTDTDTDLDSDEYIDLSSYVENNLKHMFQFHLMDKKLLIKHIGKSSDTPDIIIMENFGSESNMSLYNCIYSHDELESIKNEKTNDDNIILKNENNLSENNSNEFEDNLTHLKLFFPIVKLIVKQNPEKNIISCIAVKLNQEIVYEKEIVDWDLYWIEFSSYNKETFKSKKIEKNINPKNILENLIKLSIL